MNSRRVCKDNDKWRYCAKPALENPKFTWNTTCPKLQYELKMGHVHRSYEPATLYFEQNNFSDFNNKRLRPQDKPEHIVIHPQICKLRSPDFIEIKPKIRANAKSDVHSSCSSCSSEERSLLQSDFEKDSAISTQNEENPQNPKEESSFDCQPDELQNELRNVNLKLVRAIVDKQVKVLSKMDAKRCKKVIHYMKKASHELENIGSF